MPYSHFAVMTIRHESGVARLQVKPMRQFALYPPHPLETLHISQHCPPPSEAIFMLRRENCSPPLAMRVIYLLPHLFFFISRCPFVNDLTVQKRKVCINMSFIIETFVGCFFAVVFRWGHFNKCIHNMPALTLSNISRSSETKVGLTSEAD